MGGFLTAFLWIGFSCKDASLQSGVSSYHSEDVLFEMHVGNGLFGSTVCASFVTSTSMTAGGECVEAILESSAEDTRHLRFLTQAGVGEVEYTVRIQNGVIKIPTVGIPGFEEGLLQSVPLEQNLLETRRSSTQKRIDQQRRDWTEGAFSLQTASGEVKGALVFDDEGVRVFVFDRHWLTPEVQYASLETDGFDWIVEFDTEPQFLDSSTYIRIHFLEGLVTIPQSSKRSESDIQYQMVPNPPSFESLKELQTKQIDQSLEDERRTLTESVRQLAPILTTEQKCADWIHSGVLQTPFWMGYSVQTKWVDSQCALDIEPETVQYRRTFIGTLHSKSN